MRAASVYIAASSREPQRVRAAQRMLGDAGHSLTFDWLAEIERVVATGIAESDLPHNIALGHAQADFDAIRAADVVWFLAPETVTRGAWVELGFSVGIGKPVIVSGAKATQSIFCHFACGSAETDLGGCALISMLGERPVRT